MSSKLHLPNSFTSTGAPAMVTLFQISTPPVAEKEDQTGAWREEKAGWENGRRVP
jgi:hypothetical protein